MTRYWLVVFTCSIVVFHVCSSERGLPEYERKRRALRALQHEGPSEDIHKGMFFMQGAAKRKAERRGLEQEEDPSIFWFVPSKEKRQQVKTGVKKRLSSLKKGLSKKRKHFNWFGLRKSE